MRTHEEAVKFIWVWRRPNGNLQAGRGQARLPSTEQAIRLIERARKEGWGDFHGEGATPENEE